MEGSSSKPIRYFEPIVLLSRIMHLSSPNSRHYIVTGWRIVWHFLSASIPKCVNRPVLLANKFPGDV